MRALGNWLVGEVGTWTGGAHVADRFTVELFGVSDQVHKYHTVQGPILRRSAQSMFGPNVIDEFVKSG